MFQIVVLTLWVLFDFFGFLFYLIFIV